MHEIQCLYSLPIILLWVPWVQQVGAATKTILTYVETAQGEESKNKDWWMLEALYGVTELQIVLPSSNITVLFS